MTHAQALDLVEMAANVWIDRANAAGETLDALAMANALNMITGYPISK